MHQCVVQIYRYSDCIGVVGSKCMQISQLTKATLDVRHMDLHIVLETTKNRRGNNG